MKINITLIAFLLFLCGHTAFSQKTLAPGVRPYAENWPSTLTNAMHRAGFDMQARKVAPQSGATQQRNMLRLDSTKTFHAYDPATGDSTPVSKTRYLYPFTDSRVEVNYQFENGNWQPVNRSLFVTDGQQRVVEILAEAYNQESQEFYFESRLEVYPHGDSHELVDSFFTYAYDTISQDWQLLMANHNTFDGQDRLLESLTTLDYLGAPVIFRERYSYNANGDNHLIEESGIFDGEESPTGKTDLMYAEHRVIEAVGSITDGINFYPQHRTNYAYTLFGAIRKEMNFQFDLAGNNWQLGHTIDYFYDNEQRLAGKETVQIQPGAWDKKERISYAYFEGQNLYVEHVHIWNDDLFDWILESKKYYYYDGSTAVDPTPGTVKTLSVSPNPGTGIFRLNLVSEAVVKVFDATGKMLQSRVLQPGLELDVTTLPPGVYILTAQQGATISSGKIVKQ